MLNLLTVSYQGIIRLKINPVNLVLYLIFGECKMLLTLIRKEIMHHILSIRFIVLLLMCLSLVLLTFSINYQNYRQNLVDYQEAVKLANTEKAKVNTNMELKPELENPQLFLKPTPLSVFANDLGDALPSYLGMTRNGITQGPLALVSASLSYLLGHLDFLFLIGTVFSLLAILFTFDAVSKFFRYTRSR